MKQHNPDKAPSPSATTAAEWCVGIVCASQSHGLTVQSGALSAPAKRAASCLLEPAPGDSVACLRVAPQELWILAVLQREASTAQVLRMDGDTRIEVHAGTLELSAPRLELRGQQVQVAAHELKVAVESAEMVGRHVRLIGSVVKVVGSVLSTVMDRVNHYSKHYLRTTDGIDRVAAIHVECEAKQLLRLTGEHALINGDKLVKARGGQIHFG